MYIPGEVRKDILKTKRDESSIIGVFPARDQGKYFVEIAWIPPRIDAVKIKAFRVYSWGHFYPDVIFITRLVI